MFDDEQTLLAAGIMLEENQFGGVSFDSFAMRGR